MNRLILAVFAAVFAREAGAQIDITASSTLKPGSVIELHPHHNEGEIGTRTDSLTVFLTPGKDYSDTADARVTFEMRSYDVPNKPVIQNNPYLIKKGTALKDGLLPIVLAIQTTNTPDTLTDAVTSFVSLKSKPDVYAAIRLTPGRQHVRDDPFWVEIGANFDLVDNIKPNNVFAGVFFYQRDIRPLFYKSGRKDNNLAISAGLYESRASTYSNSPDNIPIAYFDSSSFTGIVRNDSIVAIRHLNVGKVKNRIEVQNLGLYFSPQLRLTKGSANSYGAHFFVSFHAEVIWQQIRNEFDYSNTNRILSDTLLVSRSQLARTDTILFPAKPEGKPMNVFSHYEGIGLPFFLKTENVNLYINPVIGMSNQPKTPDITTLQSITENRFERDWRAFYLVQFRLSEEKFGLSLSGEVRGLLAKQSPPFMTVLLSKKFDLYKLVSYR